MNMDLNDKLFDLLCAACEKDPKGLPYILNLCTPELLIKPNKYDKTPIGLACKYQPDAVKLILDSDKCTTETLDIHYVERYNVLMVACCYQPDAVKYILESEKFTPEMLNKRNLTGRTALMVASTRQPDAVKYILNSEKCTTELLNKKDGYGFTALMDACIHNKDSAKYILESDKCTSETLSIQHNKITALTYACIHQHDAVKYILESNKCSELLQFRNINDLDSAKYLINNNPILHQYFMEYFERNKPSVITNEVVNNKEITDDLEIQIINAEIALYELKIKQLKRCLTMNH